MNEKIILVDDEPNILTAYSRTLRRQFSMVTADSGAKALQLMASEGPFAVIVSDMRMPEMDGLQLLSTVKQKYPDTVRVMLTGNADQQTAIDAVNEGDVFRFLNKPCPADNMANTLNLAIKQHQLISAEKDLLENTLKGSIEALCQTLQLANPEVFGHSNRIKELMTDCAQALQLENIWALESSAMLCQLGYVALPAELVSKTTTDTSLSKEETQQFNQHSRLAADLIGNIPRMEQIAANIRYQNNHFDGSAQPLDGLQGEQIPIGARLLKVILDFHKLECSNMDTGMVLARLQSHAHIYDPVILAALPDIVNAAPEQQLKQVNITALAPGMTLAQDIYTHSGMLLARKGQPVSDSLCERLTNFYRNGNIEQAINVSL